MRTGGARGKGFRRASTHAQAGAASKHARFRACAPVRTLQDEHAEEHCQAAERRLLELQPGEARCPPALSPPVAPGLAVSEPPTNWTGISVRSVRAFPLLPGGYLLLHALTWF